tara:strand:+ start:1613 stop:2305 length:693 start_codon:yes stop_codon:yes gene_type:complete
VTLDETKAGLDAVEEGPHLSERSTGSSDGKIDDPDGHPSVVALLLRFGDSVSGHRVSAGTQHVVWIDSVRNLEVLHWLRDDQDHQYDMISDITAVDYGAGRPIDVVYQLFSTVHKRALRIRCALPLDGLEIDSVVELWSAANWLEREIYDLFGVTFRKHPDLRRILMPHDYEEGHPLRKDFPLRGRFSRAEQTRRALDQSVEHSYIAEEMDLGRDPQQAAPIIGTKDRDG